MRPKVLEPSRAQRLMAPQNTHQFQQADIRCHREYRKNLRAKVVDMNV